MKTLIENIKELEKRLSDPKKSVESREREESYLYHLRAYREHLRRVTDEMLPQGMKFCYRHGQLMVEQCNVCEYCLKPEDLACNEGTE